MDTYDEQNLINRALSAYFGKSRSEDIVQPAIHLCTVEENDNMVYIVIRNNHKILLVYRWIENGNYLRRLARIPSFIEQD